MEFKLKEGWFSYFMAGLIMGLNIMMFLIYTEAGRTVSMDIVYNFVEMTVLSIVSFLFGCKVGKKVEEVKQNEMSQM